MIIVDSSIRAQQPWKPMRNQAMVQGGLGSSKRGIEQVRDDLLSHHSARTVESNYEAFCQHVNDIITSHVPTKQQLKA